jgi:hypothetical protein
MKKLNYLLLLIATVLFASCGEDGDNTMRATFEGMPVTNNYYTSSNGTLEGYYYHSTFQDTNNLLTFDYYIGNWTGATFAGFAYTNSTDVTTGNSAASICGKAKVGTMYLAAYASSYTPARLKINNTTNYSINGCWISNSVYAYNSMTTADYAPATPFSKVGDYYKVVATGYSSDGTTKVGSTSIYLAKYASATDIPSKDWQWFDLTPLAGCTYVQFDVESSDTGDYGVNTSTNFCLDGIILDAK